MCRVHTAYPRLQVHLRPSSLQEVLSIVSTVQVLEWPYFCKRIPNGTNWGIKSDALCRIYGKRVEYPLVFTGDDFLVIHNCSWTSGLDFGIRRCMMHTMSTILTVFLFPVYVSVRMGHACSKTNVRLPSSSAGPSVPSARRIRWFRNLDGRRSSSVCHAVKFEELVKYRPRQCRALRTCLSTR